MHRDDVKPGMMVHARGEGGMGGAKGAHVGTVVGLSDQATEQGDYIEIADDRAGHGQHRWIPFEWVSSVDDLAVYLDKTPDELETGDESRPARI